MSTSDLRSLLDDVPDTLEIVLRRDPSWSPVLRGLARRGRGGLRGARRLAALAVARRVRAYRAAQDREDAAQDTLVQTQTSRTSVS